MGNVLQSPPLLPGRPRKAAQPQIPPRVVSLAAGSLLEGICSGWVDSRQVDSSPEPGREATDKVIRLREEEELGEGHEPHSYLGRCIHDS